MRYNKRKWKKQISTGHTTMDYETWKLTNELWDKCPGSSTTIDLNSSDKSPIHVQTGKFITHLIPAILGVLLKELKFQLI